MGNRGRTLSALGIGLGLASLALTSFAFVYIVRSRPLSRLDGAPRSPWRGEEREESAGEDRQLSGFTRVLLRGTADVHVSVGSRQSVRVEAGRRMLPSVITEVRDGELVIGERGRSPFSGPFDVFLTMERVDALEVSGAGRIIGETTIAAESLNLSVEGSGGIAAHVEAGTVRTNVSGSGRLTVSGNAGSHESSISGSGRIEAFGLETLRSAVRISGSGRARVNASEALEADVSGSGEVEYQGNPVVSERVTGSGGVRRAE